MLATTPPSTPTTSHQYYSHTFQFLPLIPSPLSPRRESIYARGSSGDTVASIPRTLPSPLSCSGIMTTPPPQDHQHGRETPVTMTTGGGIPFSQRAIKAVPMAAALNTRPDALRERRRDIFLKKVRREREDRRWDGRVEDVSFFECLSFTFLLCCSPPWLLGSRERERGFKEIFGMMS